MTFEVLSGSRPGRPALLAVLSAAVLAVAIAFAWLQSANVRALGPEQQVGDTPLYVQPPEGWQVDPEDPARFILPVGETGPRGRLFTFERAIRFGYELRPGFQSREQLLIYLGLTDPRQHGQPRPAKLGPFEAIELQTIHRQQHGRRILLFEKLLRFAYLPRGHLIVAEYEPLIELRPADRAIMEDVCRTLRLDDPTLTRNATDYLQAAGLDFDPPPDWTIVGPHLPRTPGVVIGGKTAGVPAWSIYAYRTWLADQRTARALLTDIAAEQWLGAAGKPLWDAGGLIEETRTGSETELLTMRHPAFGRTSQALQAVWSVTESDNQVLLLLVYAGPNEAATADQAAGRIARAVRLDPLPGFPPDRAARQAGVALVRDLHRRGPVVRWGFEDVDARYIGRRLIGQQDGQSFRNAIRRMNRTALGGRPPSRYQGEITWELRGRRNRGARICRESWELDGHLDSYRWQQAFVRDNLDVEIREQHGVDSSVIRRVVGIETGGTRRQETTRFEPGPAFVPPPVESIALGWVARGEPETAFVVMSSRLGPGTHSVLLRQSADGSSFPRVLLQKDYWPVGTLVAFDDDQAIEIYRIGPDEAYRHEDVELDELESE